jgi:hypothetical protein
MRRRSSVQRLASAGRKTMGRKRPSVMGIVPAGVSRTVTRREISRSAASWVERGENGDGEESRRRWRRRRVASKSGRSEAKTPAIHI